MEPTAASENEALVAKVREKYGQIAGAASSCCGPVAACCAAAGGGGISQALGYESSALEAVPEGADLGLGCGAPIGHLDLQPGETVLDLGSGAGLDAFLAAGQVGDGGNVIGVDMTPEMLTRARDNARKIGAGNVEFREGRLENLPVADASIDAVTSNCVVNLVPDKAAVFREIARVLKPGGRLVISDIVLDGRLPAVIEQDLYAYVGCVSGATLRAEYFDLVRAAGLGEIQVLRDIDFGAAVIETAPEEAQRLFDRAGTSRAEIVGKVRSLTFRAVKPA